MLGSLTASQGTCDAAVRSPAAHAATRRTARQMCAATAGSVLLPAQELGGLEGEVERLAGVEPRIALGLVALLEMLAEHLEAAADALGDVLARELDVHTAGPHLGR